MGSEYREISHLLEALKNAQPQQEGQGAEQTADSQGAPASNQYGNEMQTTEMAARGAEGGMR
jgi:hypothetical protein